MQAMQPWQRRRAPHFDHLQAAPLPHVVQPGMQAHDHVCCGAFRVERGVAEVRFSGDHRGCPRDAQRGADIVEELARAVGVHHGIAHSTKAIEHHQRGLLLPRQLYQGVAGGGQSARPELVEAQDQQPLADQVFVKEAQGAHVCEELAHRLRERGEHQDTAARARAGKGNLAGQCGLAAARLAHDQRQRAAWQPAPEHQVQVLHPCWIDHLLGRGNNPWPCVSRRVRHAVSPLGLDVAPRERSCRRHGDRIHGGRQQGKSHGDHGAVPARSLVLTMRLRRVHGVG